MIRCPVCLKEHPDQEGAHFCPYCGRPVNVTENNALTPAVVVHVQDDRTRLAAKLQRKYWEKNRGEFREALMMLLSYEIPPATKKRKRKPAKLVDFDGPFGELQQATSTSSVFFHVDAMLKAISRIIGSPDSGGADAQAMSGINMQHVIAQINERAAAMMALVIGQEKTVLTPQIIYRPLQQTDDVDAQYNIRPLYEAIILAYKRFKTVVSDGGIFVALAQTDEVDGFDPENFCSAEGIEIQAEEITALAAKPYDPLFPEAAALLVLAFWKGLKLLLYAADSMLAVPGQEETLKNQIQAEIENQLSALGRLCEYWQKKFDAELDRAFAQGELDMLNVYARIRDISKEV